jgi:DNA-binding transcriptional ArsR family regulator
MKAQEDPLGTAEGEHGERGGCHAREPIASAARSNRAPPHILKSSQIPLVPFEATPLYVTKATMFRTLGHPARVRMLELLQDGEQSVGALQDALDLDSGGTSQHLGALRRIGLVESRREGTSVYYRAADPQVFALLEVGRALIAHSLQEHQVLLDELAAE